MTLLEKEFDNFVKTLLSGRDFAKTLSQKGSAYPPYNIIKISQSEIVLEIAVAGFKEDEISVTVDSENVSIKGKKDNTDVADYIYKGIGARSFDRTFALSKDSKVEKAEYADGILSVYIKYNMPEKSKPKNISISRGEREYLTERDDII